jgi:hypothetical protein
MSDSTVSESQDREIEISIIRAFANAIIEFEPVLYQKFLLQTRGLVTEEIFKERLTKMEDKGYIAPLIFQGRQCWRRIASEDDVCAEYHSQEEVRGIIEEGQALAMQRKRVTEGGTSLVTQMRQTAQELLELVKSQYSDSDESEEVVREKMRYHFETMRQELADSEDNFLKYVQTNFSQLYDKIKEILSSKGEDVILPALRIVEASMLEPNG